MALEILGIASDIAGGKLGSAKGVALLCEYMRVKNLAVLRDRNYLFLDSDKIPLADKNDCAKHIALLYDFFKDNVAQRAQAIIHENKFPFIISGDHSSALAVVQGIQNALPNDTIGVVWIDAHADIHTPLSTFSGNLHGMPLAALIGHKAANKNKITQSQLESWEKLMNISKVSIKPQNVVYCGIRSLEKAEQDVIDSHNMCVLDIESLQNNRAYCLEQMKTCLSQSTKIYVSVDIDVLDCNEFQSTGCNEVNGLYMRELTSLIKDITETFQHKIVAFELSEFNPTLGTTKEQDKVMLFNFLHEVTNFLTSNVVSH
ncbi:arginase family protein [Helicobacter trogontum]|uniref:Arginase n=1 Tax=Helicobacter trogontum TaxID=50960 RepID=A0A4U8TBQ6_9HELI|nr:arginase family protein [Helicobacter trogontum]TLD96648.1 arginase [Helicobacter trogontum]